MAKASKTIRARLHFIEEVLGTASANKELHSEYIASKAPDAKKREDEVAAIGVEAATEKAMTVFPRNEAGQKILWGYSCNRRLLCRDIHPPWKSLQFRDIR